MAQLTARTSTIFIATSDDTRVYRSVDDVPLPLRQKLLECTRGMNSATILIADKQGREELVRALQGRPSEVQCRLVENDRGPGNPLPVKRCRPFHRSPLRSIVAGNLGSRCRRRLALGFCSKPIFFKFYLQILTTIADKLSVTTSFGDHPHSALLKISSGEPNGSKHEIPCTFEGMDGKTLRLEAPERISISAPVSVEYSDAMFLGEVIGCQRSAGGIWELNIKVSQILTGLQSLCNLRAQLLGEGVAVTTRGFIPVSGAGLN